MSITIQQFIQWSAILRFDITPLHLSLSHTHTHIYSLSLFLSHSLSLRHFYPPAPATVCLFGNQSSFLNRSTAVPGTDGVKERVRNFRGWVRGLKGKHTEERRRQRERERESKKERGERRGESERRDKNPASLPGVRFLGLLTCAHDSRGTVSISPSHWIPAVMRLFVVIIIMTPRFVSSF